MNKSLGRAFTLVELLVVITIIVVLLALLIPAMDKAIYQAELAVCGSSQRALAQAAFVYAGGNRRMFPSNQDPRYTGFAYQPDLIGAESDPTRDIRPILKDYVGYKNYRDPLTAEVAFDPESNFDDTLVFSNYYIFFGWQWTGQYGGKGMLRQGDSIEFYDTFNQENVRTTVMVTERHLTSDNGWAQSAHPDVDKSVMRNEARQNAPVNFVRVEGVGAGIGHQTYSVWGGGNNGNPRGGVDLNYAHNDGSVQRILSVELRDDRLRRSPAHAQSDIVQETKGWLPPN